MNAWEQFVHWLRGVFKPEPPAGTLQLQTLHRKVLVINFDPRCPTGDRQPLSSQMKEFVFEKEHRVLLDVDTLVDGFVADVRKCSQDLVDYQVVESILVDAWPRKQDGFSYTWDTFVPQLGSNTGWHAPDLVDYDAIIRDFNILRRIETERIDEVWLFGFPFAGFLESIMGGPRAFSCNSGGRIIRTRGVSRRFVIMGFSWERGVGEMLEDLGHRFEDCLKETWKHHHGDDNLWEEFTRCDREFHGGANVGTMHFAPNSREDYDWGNETFVESNCVDWMSFPNRKRTKGVVNCSEWGCTPRGLGGEDNTLAHHEWWFTHLPKVQGETQGIANNWWLYGIDPNAIP